MSAAKVHQPETPREPFSRRDFLRVGGLSFVGLSVAERAALAASRRVSDRRSVILILMTGGPSQFETFDPKPEATAAIRGPLKPIATAIPGVSFCETLPRLAERASRFGVIRSMCHDAAPIHETGLQLLQTGRLAQGEHRPPSFGAMISRELGPRSDVPPYVVVPNLLGHTGVNAYRGQSAGSIGEEFNPVSNDAGQPADGEEARPSTLEQSVATEAERRRYGDTRFGNLCLQARHLVESGVRCVTVNLFGHLNGNVTWDCHARKHESPATLFDYRDTLGPQFDRAVASLIDDLDDRGMLDDTLIVAAGEFGRTPKINTDGGRDHWPHAYSALVAGGGVQGGRVIGSSDRQGSAVSDRPVSPAQLVASVYRSIGIDGAESLALDAEPVRELFDA